MEWSRGQSIGHGSFGSVNLLIPRNNKKLVNHPLMAVKSALVFNSETLVNERDVLNELRDCENIIRCYGDDYSSENGERFYNLFLEYASRGNLADQIKNSGGGLSGNTVRRYTKSILKGIQCIHVNGYVHCDIKTQNILLCSENGNDVVKIADFGLAKRANCTEKTGFRGTPLNMSPESVTGGENESPVDIWAFGCVVVEMVTGKSAWKSRSDSDMCSLLFRIGISDELPEIPGKLSEEGKNFLGKCFVKDPRKRWTAQMLLDHPFLAGIHDSGGDQDDADIVSLKVMYEEASNSPRCPFDFRDCEKQSSSIKTTSPKFELQFESYESHSIDFYNSSEERLRRLITDRRPNWLSSENWVTVR